MTSTYSISFPYSGSGTFNGIFTVNNTTNIIESFYDSNNNSILSQGCNTFQNIYNNLTGNLLCSLLLINSGSYLILQISSSQSYYFIDTTCRSVTISQSTTFTITPYTPPPPPPPRPSIISLKKICCSIYSDNALVYYKPHSLATAGSGTVRNSRKKGRKT